MINNTSTYEAHEKYSTIEDVMASFTHPVLPTVQGEPDYQTTYATRNLQSTPTWVEELWAT
jgi:hypothetical protein